MQLFHIHHHLSLYRFLHSDLKHFELSVWLHVFSRAMVAIFIPIFLLKTGYSLGDVVIYYVIVNIFNVPLNFFARFLTRHLGAKWVIIAGSLFSMAFFISLYNLGPDNWPLLILMAFFGAIYDALYWVAHIYFFMKCSHGNKNMSKDTSGLYIAKRIARVISPAFGAVILIFFERNALIIISIIILAFSIWPLFKIKNTKDKPARNQIKFLEFFGNWSRIKDYLSVGLFGMHCAAEYVIWPIFIFVIFGSIESVAALPIIISATTIIFTFLAGRVTKSTRSRVMAIGGIFIGSIWILRLLVDNTIFYYASVVLVGFFSVLVSLPLDSNIFEKGERVDTLSTATYRNAVSMFARLVFFSVLAVLINVFHVSFITASISMFIMVAVNLIGHRTFIPGPRKI